MIFFLNSRLKHFILLYIAYALRFIQTIYRILSADFTIVVIPLFVRVGRGTFHEVGENVAEVTFHETGIGNPVASGCFLRCLFFQPLIWLEMYPLKLWFLWLILLRVEILLKSHIINYNYLPIEQEQIIQ